MKAAASIPQLYVLAGVNGAGKSSIAGATFRSLGGDYYNPDEAARVHRLAHPGLSQAEANSRAWQTGVMLLERAIAARLDFTFETTLGASTIPRLLAEAADQGFQIHVWYAGLANVELHIKRVSTRVKRGGHNIPVAKIHERYETSRLNLIKLMPKLTTLKVYDNSIEADPTDGNKPQLKLVLDMKKGKILNAKNLLKIPTPTWAKPIVAAAIKLTMHKQRTNMHD